MAELRDTFTMMRPAAEREAVDEAVGEVRERLRRGDITTAEYEGEKALAEMRALDGFRFQTSDDVEAYWERSARRRGEKVKRSRRKLDAYENAGRWVADCDCRSGIACSPSMPTACCMACLTVYHVRFPEE